jgi:hypothetical protein
MYPSSLDYSLDTQHFHSLIHKPNRQFTHSPIHSPIHPFIHSPIHPCTPSLQVSTAGSLTLPSASTTSPWSAAASIDAHTFRRGRLYYHELSGAEIPIEAVSAYFGLDTAACQPRALFVATWHGLTEANTVDWVRRGRREKREKEGVRERGRERGGGGE